MTRYQKLGTTIFLSASASSCILLLEEVSDEPTDVPNCEALQFFIFHFYFVLVDLFCLLSKRPFETKGMFHAAAFKIKS